MSNRRRDAKLQQLALNRLAAQYERKISRHIASAMIWAADNLSDPQMLAELETRHAVALEKTLASLWRASASMVYGQIFTESKKKLGADIRPTVTANAVAADFIRTYGLAKITQISRTTLDDIRLILAASAELSERDIARAIRDVAPTKSASRAQTIARTESHSAAAYAAQMSVESTGVEMRREWVTAVDERAREDHIMADGQIVGMNEPFIVGDSALMYPGDPDGSAEQVINCRCVIAYVVV